MFWTKTGIHCQINKGADDLLWAFDEFTYEYTDFFTDDKYYESKFQSWYQ